VRARGDKLADEELAEHAEAEQTIKRLEETEFSDPAFATLLGQLMQEIRHHVQEEEQQLFPQLAGSVDRQGSVSDLAGLLAHGPNPARLPIPPRSRAGLQPNAGRARPRVR